MLSTEDHMGSVCVDAVSFLNPRKCFTDEPRSLVIMFLLPLRSALAASALPPIKKEIDAESTSSFEKSEQVWPPQLYSNFDRPATREQERWMQRRNSLSSQKAIYPYAFEPRRSATYSMGYGYSPSSHYSFQRNTIRSFSDSQATLYDAHRSGSFTSVSRPVTAISSSGSMYSRRYRQANPSCPAIPESPNQSIDKTSLLPKPVDIVSTLPAAPAPAWCPPLQHAPLSSDPAIRALTGSSANQLKPAAPSANSIKTLGSSTISSTYTPTNPFSRSTTATTTTMPSLSRATTTQTSILNLSRPSTALTSSRSASTVSSTTSSRDPSPPPPLPSLPPPPTQPPPAVPRRAPGHAASQPRTPTLNAYGTGTATLRTLRRPEVIGVRSGRAKGLWTYGGTGDRSAVSGTAGLGVTIAANAKRHTPSQYAVASNPWTVVAPTTPVLVAVAGERVCHGRKGRMI